MRFPTNSVQVLSGTSTCRAGLFRGAPSSRCPWTGRAMVRPASSGTARVRDDPLAVLAGDAAALFEPIRLQAVTGHVGPRPSRSCAGVKAYSLRDAELRQALLAWPPHPARQCSNRSVRFQARTLAPNPFSSTAQSQHDVGTTACIFGR